MHKHILPGLIMATALSPVMAATYSINDKSASSSVPRNTIALCMLLGLGLRGVQRKQADSGRELVRRQQN